MNQLIIFSLDQMNKKASEDDIKGMKSLLFGSGLIPRPALGVYKGLIENSFIVEVEREVETQLVRAIARVYNQECILTIRPNREAVMEYLLPENKIKRKVLGYWFRTDIINRESMTLDLETLKAYEVR